MYPGLVSMVQIMLVEMLPNVLAMYSKEVSTYTENQFRRCGIKLFTSHRVNQVSSQDGGGSRCQGSTSCCCWAEAAVAVLQLRWRGQLLRGVRCGWGQLLHLLAAAVFWDAIPNLRAVCFPTSSELVGSKILVRLLR